jgi:excisionase family DNA binding protein
MSTEALAESQPPLAESADRLLTKAQLAERLQISPRTCDTWLRQKKLVALKIGKTVRFNWPDVLQRLNEQCRIT